MAREEVVDVEETFEIELEVEVESRVLDDDEVGLGTDAGGGLTTAPRP
jgi:hypothetical protein